MAKQKKKKKPVPLKKPVTLKHEQKNVQPTQGDLPMSNKSDLTELISIARTTLQHSIDDVANAVQNLPEGDVNIEALQQQVRDFKVQVAAIQAAFDADEATLAIDVTNMSAEKAAEAKLQARLDAIQAILSK